MDWISANLYRSPSYGLVYPQIFPQHRSDSDAAQAVLLERSREASRRWLGILDRSLDYGDSAITVTVHEIRQQGHSRLIGCDGTRR